MLDKRLNEYLKENRGSLMQVLKESVKEAILTNAQELMLVNGYDGMTMRMIAKAIGMSVSNLYKYFPDKQTLYRELVTTTYQNTIDRLYVFFSEENEGNYTEENITNVSHGLAKRLITNREIFIILMENSFNTECLALKQTLCEAMSKHIIEGTDQNSGYEDFIIRIIVKNIWDGIEEITKYSKDENTIYDRLYHLLKYHFIGLSLFHDKR